MTCRSSDSMCPFSFVVSWSGMLNDDGIDADVTEGVVLRGRRLLHQEVAFAVPEDRVRARPADRDVLPEARRQRRLDVVVDAAARPVLVRLARGVRARRLAVEEHVGAPARPPHHERMPSLVGQAALHQRELSAQREREPPAAAALGDRLAGHAVLHGDPLGAGERADHAVDEMERGRIPHPAVLQVVERDEVAVVVLVGVVLLRDVVLAVHVSVGRRPHRGIELRDGAEVLDPDVCDAARVIVSDDLAAAPALLDRAGERGVDGDRVVLHVDDDPVQVDVEGLPAAAGRVGVHADRIDPRLVADATNNHGVAGLEAAQPTSP